MASRVEVAKVIAVLEAGFPAFRSNVPIAQVVDVWAQVLGDLDATGLLRAATSYLEGHTFFPSVGELRARYFELGETANGIPAAQEAWSEVKHAFRRGFSRWHAPTAETWTHPLVHRALDCIGGWYALCDSENDAADRARFIEAYNVLLGRERDRERMLPQVREYIEQLAAQMKDRAQLGPGVNR